MKLTERLQEAFDKRVERDNEIAKLRVAHERTRPTQKVSVTSTAIMGLITGALMR